MRIRTPANESAGFTDRAGIDVPDHPGCYDKDQDSKQFAKHQSREVCCNVPAKETPARQFTAPRLWCATVPLIIVGIITARDVPKASRVAIVLSMPPFVYSQNWTGVIRKPLLTPKRPEAVPVRIPVKKRLAY
jgi:hypothetical protein